MAVTTRARDPQHKALRRRDILKAADELIDLRARSLPSVARIAQQAGLAKGTLYLYFRTREEIYLALLGEWFVLCVDVVDGALNSSRPSVEGLLQRYTRFCARNPKFVYLSSMSSTILEQNISEEMAYAFKKGLADQVGALTARLSAMVPGITDGQARRCFIHMFSLTNGLWRHCHPPQAVERAYEREDAVLVKMDFQQDLHDALLALFNATIQPRSEES